MTNNRIFKSVRTVPNYLHTEFHLHSPPRHVHWGLISGKPDFASLYASLSHNHDERYYQKSETYSQTEVDALVAAGTAPDLSNYYDKQAIDLLLLTKAPASHSHDFVTGSTLNTLLADKVDYNSLGLILNGYEQIDSNIIRWVSS